MDSSEVHLDRIEAQRSTNVSHDQRKGRYFPMNLINKVARKLCSRGGDGATPSAGDTESGLEFLNNLKLSDLFDLPGENVQMNTEIFSRLSDGDKECLEKLKSHGTPMACLKSDRGDSILHLAARWGHLELVKNIVSECPCLVLETNSKDQLPLHVAAHAGHSAIVEAFVASDKYGNTALHLAIEGRYMEMAASLVNENQNASFLENNEGISSLYMAVEAGDVSLVKEILKTTGNDDLEGRNSNLDLKLEGRKYLVHVALDARSTGVLDVILNEYPSLEDERDEEGRTCLSFAASIGFYEGVCNLLDRSTKNVYVCDEDGSFPIHTAAENGHIRIVKEILKRCPHSKHMLNKLGQNVLHIAAKIGEDNLVASLMLEDETKHLSVGQDVNGNTPLHLATLNWRYRSIRQLASDVKILQLRNDNGLTARGLAESVLKPNYIFHERLTLAFLLYAHKLKGSGSVKSLTKPSEPLDHEKSRDYVNTLLLVAALVATMTFAAGFTIPGGFNSSGPHLGRATLATDPSLFYFLLFDILAMQSSLATICTLIWAQLGDPSLVSSSLKLALPLLVFALLCMPLAFVFGVGIVIKHVKWFSLIIILMFILFFYLVAGILAPHVLLQLPNVSPVLCGCILETIIRWQETLSGARWALFPTPSFVRLKKD
ncbi:PGG domain [Arabidopsis suecica]|uniref:PGG domain n=1 Tax=Arabidopsis suecica TaxID=45249 RepID=A0A8T1ZHN0_ARASU|nr:PGG domain [Arabidopsis suecica]